MKETSENMKRENIVCSNNFIALKKSKQEEMEGQQMIITCFKKENARLKEELLSLEKSKNVRIESLSSKIEIRDQEIESHMEKQKECESLQKALKESKMALINKQNVEEENLYLTLQEKKTTVEILSNKNKIVE